MIDFDVLEDCGTTNNRIREFFTAELPSNRVAETMDKAKLKQIEKDVKKRKKFEEMISDWMNEHVMYSLANHKLWSSADIAWDSVPINKQILPLIQYAQGRIDIERAEKALKDVPNGETYIKRDNKGKATHIEMPKFTEMNINLVRSVITRRVAAQAAKYSLWPHFNYEPRDMTLVGRFRGDCTNQRMDIMADAYAYKHLDVQVQRDMLLYPNGSMVFPRCPWERDVQWIKDKSDPAFATGKLKKKTVVVREGVCFVNPHPSRVFYDNNYPIATLNTDTGCEYVGFWDVCRWGDIADNPEYYNRKKVTFTSDMAAWFTQYATYFNQYYDRIVPPTVGPIGDPAANNDRKNHVGVYTGELTNASAFFTNVWVKVIPKTWGWGTYPYPIWVHLKAAGDATVIHNAIMPSSPGATFQFNCHDGRFLNISLAHELMQYQDQLSNLYSQLLETIKADLFSVAVLNTDIFPDTDDGKKIRTEFERVLAGKNYYTSMQLLQVSFEKLGSVLGDRQITADMIFKVVRATPNTAITELFEAIAKVITMADRVFVMSAHEQGQTAQHEITASESNQIASSTDTVYSFISRGVDEGRSAMKKICFESTIACGSDMVELPVVNRYPQDVVEKAGFKIKTRDDDDPISYMVVMGHKDGLVHDYIFTSRDGSERVANSQAAQVIVQLLGSIGALHPSAQTAILSGMGKSKLFEIMNTVFRLADAGVDIKLALKPGEEDSLLIEDDQQVMGIIQKLAESVKQNTVDVAQMKQMGAQLAQMIKPGPAKESISINYADAPAEIQRQMEAAAGFKPAITGPGPMNGS